LLTLERDSASADGEGMVHFVRLRGAGDGGAEYGCRYVRTRGFLENDKAGRRTQLSLTEKPLPLPILRGLASKGLHWAMPDSPYWCGLASGSERKQRPPRTPPLGTGWRACGAR
jgi:hypothetical protein